VKKLEKENAALKQDRGLISALGEKTYRIAESKELGEHAVVTFGHDGSERAHTLVFHSRIGVDGSIPDGSLCVSDSKDIKEFFATKVHPGLQKIQKNISEQEKYLAVTSGVLIALPGEEFAYPGYTRDRNSLMEEPREMRALYMDAKGLKPSQAPCVEWFMPKALGSLEITYRHGVLKHKDYVDKLGKIYLDIAEHKPHTLNGTTQNAPRYLYGMDVKMLEQQIYNRLAGRAKDAPAKEPPPEYDVITTGIPHPMMKFPSSDELGRLQSALKGFKTSKKKFHVAEQEAKQTKGKSKDEKKALAQALADCRKNLDTAKSTVRAADIKYGDTELYQNHPIIRAIRSKTDGKIRMIVVPVTEK
jgi:hypothetical protein